MVRITTAADFFSRVGAGDLFRGAPDQALRQHSASAVLAALTQLGKPYAQDFRPPPSEFYCSSLVEWAYERASGAAHVLVPQVAFALIFEPQDYWRAYYKAMNQTLPHANGSNPTLLLQSTRLDVSRVPADSPPSLR